jgi:hypothetical protein
MLREVVASMWTSSSEISGEKLIGEDGEGMLQELNDFGDEDFKRRRNTRRDSKK